MEAANEARRGKAEPVDEVVVQVLPPNEANEAGVRSVVGNQAELLDLVRQRD